MAIQKHDTGWFGGHLKDEKSGLEDITKAIRAPNMTVGLQQIIRRIQTEMTLKGLDHFEPGDITISSHSK